MTSMEQMDRLTQRLPLIAREAKTAAAYWLKIDEAMELVWDCADTEVDRAHIDFRYDDFAELAERIRVGSPA